MSDAVLPEAEQIAAGKAALLRVFGELGRQFRDLAVGGASLADMNVDDLHIHGGEGAAGFSVTVVDQCIARADVLRQHMLKRGVVITREKEAAVLGKRIPRGRVE